jgi:hypothetical protein
VAQIDAMNTATVQARTGIPAHMVKEVVRHALWWIIDTFGNERLRLNVWIFRASLKVKNLAPHAERWVGPRPMDNLFAGALD